jgi:hypothetical protein
MRGGPTRAAWGADNPMRCKREIGGLKAPSEQRRWGRDRWGMRQETVPHLKPPLGASISAPPSASTTWGHRRWLARPLPSTAWFARLLSALEAPSHYASVPDVPASPQPLSSFLSSQATPHPPGVPICVGPPRPRHQHNCASFGRCRSSSRVFAGRHTWPDASPPLTVSPMCCFLQPPALAPACIMLAQPWTTAPVKPPPPKLGSPRLGQSGSTGEGRAWSGELRFPLLGEMRSKLTRVRVQFFILEFVRAWGVGGGRSRCYFFSPRRQGLPRTNLPTNHHL